VSVLTFADDSQITHQIFPAHGTGVNAVSWAPAVAPGSMEKAAVPGSQNQALVRRFATGGSDCAVRIWEFNTATSSYSSIAELSGHTGWVRDVAWSPSLLGGKAYIASASQDRTVRIWTSSDSSAAEGSWTSKTLTFECLVWRVSWSLSGNVLAVSGADNKVTLWKERVRDGGWECIKTIEE
jgi:protein transport protein SEC13